MIRRDVEQHRDIAIEALGQVDLVTRQLQHIDAAFGQRVLRQDRQADVAAHRRRHARGLEDVMDQRGRGRLAVGAGNADHLVRRKLGPGTGKQLDVADDLNARIGGTLRDRVAVEREARSDDDGIELGEVALNEIFNLCAFRHLRSRLFLIIPRRHPRSARKQRLDRRQAASC